jgi:hypothetical protein
MPATAAAPAPAVKDRVAAYCSPDGPEVFSGVVHGAQVWTPDPFDVEDVHPEARAAFARLLGRASSPELPPHGKSLLLLGEAGSGKTHLMRAFRTAAHADGAGYCGYMQMLTRCDNYARYALSYLIDSLEQPYRPGDPATGLARLARGLLDALDMIPDADRQKLREDILEPAEVAALVFRFADIAVQYEQFAGIDINLLRAVLFLLPNDGRIRPKVLNWLRCEDMPKYDTEALGGLVPRPGPEMPLKTVVGLGRLMHAVHSAALVLLVDQLDEMIEVARTDAEPGEQFRSAVNTLIDIADALPNAVVVIGCIEDIYTHAAERQYLSRPKLDRLEHDPEPIRLKGRRTVEEIRAIVGRRLEVFFDAFGIEPEPGGPLAPYAERHLAPLAGMRTRDVLAYFREHREACARARRWVEPPGSVAPPPPPPPPADNFAQLWSDFLAGAKPVIVDEPKLADLLAWSISAASDEMPNGVVFGTDADDRFVEVEVQNGDGADKLLVAVCDRSAKGGGLGKQLEEVARRAGEIPSVFVRSTDFPLTPGAAVVKQLAKLCAPVGVHRRAVVANSDWRAMSAFRTFEQRHGEESGFARWRKSDRPLASLPSLRKVLDLDRLEAPGPPEPLPPSPPLPPAGRAKEPDAPMPAAPTEPEPPDRAGSIPLGRTRGAVPLPVELEAKSLCRHAAFLGGSGSGKTTAALAVIEQLLLAGVPAVLLDRKGDLARYADPDAWAGPESDPARAARRAALRAAVEVALYTPGEDSGRPLAIPVAPPGLSHAPAAEREQVAQFAAAGLGSMMGYKSKGVDPKLVILQKGIEALAAAGQPITAKSLQKLVEQQDEALLALFDGQFEVKHFKALATDLLVLSHSHRRLLEGGEELDVDALLGRGTFATPGKTRLSVVSTQFLGGTAATEFWVAQLLLSVDRWRAKNPAPEGVLQAAFLFDEADLYLPAVGKPATKGPMEGLLRRARSAGIGLFLATQSPGDFDYKCRDQVLTWLIGRVKEPVAVGKLKPMLEPKPGAADRLADQKAGEFCLVREGDVQLIRADRNLLGTGQLAEDRVLTLARAARR